ncbi:hypothetical protein VNI00_010365 [Paramarasmius palmivorus]|uniref:F-box domain-containing protein n=1 Tax=Paramarasmius palmivorus TaxID=297713 RepID=A0AAW0CLE8_9AGAR
MEGNYSQINVQWLVVANPAQLIFTPEKLQAQEPVLEQTVIAAQPTPNNSAQSQHNAQLPVSRLPTETLTKILLHSMDDALIYKSALVLSHVCHLWRAILVNYPPIWSAPDFSRPPLAREMIQRSKPGPLDVDLDSLRTETGCRRRRSSPRQPQGCSLVLKSAIALQQVFQGLHQSLSSTGSSKLVITPESLSVLKEALGDPSRIRSFKASSFVIGADLLEQFLSRLEKLPIPSLRKLEVHSDQDGGFELPEIFFSSSPNLKKVRLVGCKVPWDRPILFSSITIASLHLDLRKATPLPTGSQFLGALAGMPFLEYLSLSDTFPLSFPDQAAVVELPCLRQLDANVTVIPQSHSCIQAFSYLSFPHSVKIRVNIPYGLSHFQPPRANGRARLLDDFFGTLSTKLGNIKALLLFYLQDSDDTNVQINAYSDSVPFDSFVNEVNRFFLPSSAELDAPFGAQLSWMDDWTPIVPIKAFLQHMLRSISLTSLETLKVDIDDDEVSTLFERLADSTTLSCIIVGSESAYRLLKILEADDADENKELSRRAHPFPALQELELLEVDLRPINSPPFLSSLLAALDRRPEKLKRLVLRYCTNVTISDLLKLEEVGFGFDDGSAAGLLAEDGDDELLRSLP